MHASVIYYQELFFYYQNNQYVLIDLFALYIDFLPIPFGRLHLASVFALTMAAWAASTDVVNPKERSMRSTSLSMVWEKRKKGWWEGNSGDGDGDDNIVIADGTIQEGSIENANNLLPQQHKAK